MPLIAVIFCSHGLIKCWQWQMFVKLEECRLDICCSTQISNADPHSQKIFAVDGILLEFGSLDWVAFKGKRSWLEGNWIGNEVLMAVEIEITLLYIVKNFGQLNISKYEYKSPWRIRNTNPLLWLILGFSTLLAP